MLSLLILAGLLFQTNAVTILSILDTMSEGVGRQALEKIIFESPRVLAIVILPYSDKSNKYMVTSLAEKCTAYLRDSLKASNVFCILPHAQKFEDKDSEDRCWEVIETEQTVEAVKSDEFVSLERSVVESVVKREKLNVKEVELFKAVDRWATKESERQGKTLDSDAKRRILGETIMKSIRFPSPIEITGVQFFFRSSPISSNGTTDTRGQFPALVFSLV